MESAARAVNGLDGFVMWGGSAPVGLGVMCFKGNVGMFVDVCVIEVQSSKAADGIDDVNGNV